MDLQTTKILVAVLFGVIRFMFGILPLKLYICLRRWEEDDGSNTFINQKRHNQVNCGIIMCQSFGGGVLFATCFLHMMLQVKKVNTLSNSYLERFSHHYRWSNFSSQQFYGQLQKWHFLFVVSSSFCFNRISVGLVSFVMITFGIFTLYSSFSCFFLQWYIFLFTL